MGEVRYFQTRNNIRVAIHINYHGTVDEIMRHKKRQAPLS